MQVTDSSPSLTVSLTTELHVVYVIQRMDMYMYVVAVTLTSTLSIYTRQVQHRQTQLHSTVSVQCPAVYSIHYTVSQVTTRVGSDISVVHGQFTCVEVRLNRTSTMCMLESLT